MWVEVGRTEDVGMQASAGDGHGRCERRRCERAGSASVGTGMACGTLHGLSVAWTLCCMNPLLHGPCVCVVPAFPRALEQIQSRCPCAVGPRAARLYAPGIPRSGSWDLANVMIIIYIRNQLKFRNPITCSLLAHYLLITCSLLAHYLLITCSSRGRVGHYLLVTCFSHRKASNALLAPLLARYLQCVRLLAWLLHK